MHLPTQQSRCRFGIAVADITPPVGIYHRMWGAATHDRSEGVHRPLSATAMYFGSVESQSDGDYHVLVAVDHCLLGVTEVNMILDRIEALSGLDRDAITISFSHTHAAGLLNLDRQELPGGDLIPAYLDRLATTVAQLVRNAANSATDADVVYGTGQCKLAAHRDLFDESNNEWVCGFHPDGPTDDTVLVARVSDDDGKILASVVNYACHPTTLAWENRLISPDYPGAMRETMREATGAPCVFLQGASGELGPVEGFVGDPAVADRNGRQLAFAALSAWEALPPANTTFAYSGKVVSGAAIGTWKRVAIDQGRHGQLGAWACDRRPVCLNYRDDLANADEVQAEYNRLISEEHAAHKAGKSELARRFRSLAERQKRALGRLQAKPEGTHYPLQTAIWRMGDAIWLAVQGEPYSLLQRRLRARFPDHPIIVATIANGWGPSYLPPSELYGKGIYQETISWLASGSLEALIDELSSRVDTLLSMQQLP